MKTSFTLSSTQFAFITAIRKITGKAALTPKNTCNGCSIGFSALRDAALAAGYAAVPAWCMTPDRKCGRGVYTLPELFAPDADISVTATKRGRPAGAKTKAKSAPKSAPAAAPVPQPAMVAAVAAAPATAMTTDAVVNMARSVTNGEADTFTPAVDGNYIPWGYHNEIKTIIKSGRFCPVFITGLRPVEARVHPRELHVADGRRRTARWLPSHRRRNGVRARSGSCCNGARCGAAA